MGAFGTTSKASRLGRVCQVPSKRTPSEAKPSILPCCKAAIPSVTVLNVTNFAFGCKSLIVCSLVRFSHTPICLPAKDSGVPKLLPRLANTRVPVTS
jgi:hypothetical protein